MKTRGYPRKRLQHTYDLCKAKSLCEGGDVMEKQFDPMSELPQDPAQPVSFYIMLLWWISKQILHIFDIYYDNSRGIYNCIAYVLPTKLRFTVYRVSNALQMTLIAFCNCMQKLHAHAHSALLFLSIAIYAKARNSLSKERCIQNQIAVCCSGYAYSQWFNVCRNPLGVVDSNPNIAESALSWQLSGRTRRGTMTQWRRKLSSLPNVCSRFSRIFPMSSATF